MDWDNIYNKTNNKNSETIKHDGKTDGVNTSLGRVLFADDAAIEYKNHHDVIKNLQTYNNEATTENFKISWNKIKILTGGDIEKIKKFNAKLRRTL